MKKFVIGCGTGRCGTRSFTKFLNENGITASHERWNLVWEPDFDVCAKSLDIMSEDGKSDVGFYWLNYVEFVVDCYPETKFVCLKRNREDVIKSFMKTIVDPIYCSLFWSRKPSEQKYILSEHVTQKELDEMDYFTREWVETHWDEPLPLFGGEMQNHFPNYDLTDKRACLKQFWNEYYETALNFEIKYPDNFRIFDMLFTLNTAEGQREVLNFIGSVPNTAVR